MNHCPTHGSLSFNSQERFLGSFPSTSTHLISSSSQSCPAILPSSSNIHPLPSYLFNSSTHKSFKVGLIRYSYFIHFLLSPSHPLSIISTILLHSRTSFLHPSTSHVSYFIFSCSLSFLPHFSSSNITSKTSSPSFATLTYHLFIQTHRCFLYHGGDRWHCDCSAS